MDVECSRGRLRTAAARPGGPLVSARTGVERGFKKSGYGKDLSGYGFEDCTRIKHVMTSL
ncbi:hypothetical protein ADK82_20795 [Streptomyces sp. NRRL S-4]|nr:hypothetical protein ADK82_20795 [Streptomyces sp. NRRL S-4]